MKTKIFFLMIAVALVTLSFTFVSVSNAPQKSTPVTSSVGTTTEPVGGIFADQVK